MPDFIGCRSPNPKFSSNDILHTRLRAVDMSETTFPISQPTAQQLFTSLGEVRQRRIPQLDGLRALAFGAVFIFHAAPQMSRKVALWAGVDLFFILSGFLITGILLRSAKRPLSSYFGEFYLKRARRILPPYVLAALLAAAFFNVNLRHEWPWYVFFASNVGQSLGKGIVPPMTSYWSLAVEEQFYLLWPVIVSICSVKSLWRFAWIGLVAVPLLRVLFSPYLSLSGGIYLLTPFRSDLLLAGALLAIVWHRCGMLPHWWKRLTIPAMGAALATYAALCLIPRFEKDSGSVLFDGLGYSLILGFCTALLSYVLTLTPGSVSYRVLTFAPIAYLGRISYMMYLVHSTCIMFCLEYLNGYSHILSRSVAFVSTILLSSLSWHFIESKLVNKTPWQNWFAADHRLASRS